MTKYRHMVMVRIACVLLLAASTLCAFPSSSLAAPSSLAHRKAEAAAVQARLAESRERLMLVLDEAEAVDEALRAARSEVASTTAAIERLDAEIGIRQAAVDERATAIYTTGGLELLEALLSVESLDDLFSRFDLLVYIQQADSDLLSGLRTARDQSSFLEQQQTQRESDIMALRQLADERRAQVDALVDTYEDLMDSLEAGIARLVAEKQAADAARAWADGGAPGEGFDPGLLITDDAFLDHGSMTVSDVQAFLDAQGGSLKSYTAPDHLGARKTAAQIIHEAAEAWGVNPKVILVTLQKEQSLISRPFPTARAYDWAMGCGKTDSRTFIRYKGFGNQVWGGAQVLRDNRDHWREGIVLSIDGSAVRPANASTHSLYRYTPHMRGVVSFWRLYWKYFGDPAK